MKWKLVCKNTVAFIFSHLDPFPEWEGWNVDEALAGSEYTNTASLWGTVAPLQQVEDTYVSGGIFIWASAVIQRKENPRTPRSFLSSCTLSSIPVLAPNMKLRLQNPRGTLRNAEGLQPSEGTLACLWEWNSSWWPAECCNIRLLEPDESPLVPPPSFLMIFSQQEMSRFPGQNPKPSGLWVSGNKLSSLLVQLLPGFSTSSGTDKWANSSTLCLFWKTQIQPCASTLTQFAT